MKCRVGDRVRFLNDVGGGTVNRIIDSKTISVLNEDGFEVPILESEVIVIDSISDKSFEALSDNSAHSDFGSAVSKNKNKTEIVDNDYQDLRNKTEIKTVVNLSGKGEPDDVEGDMLGLYIAFVPKDQLNVEDTEKVLYIINDSTYRIFYSIGKWNKQLGFIDPLASGILLPDTKEPVASFRMSELKNTIEINIQAIFFKNTLYVAQQPEYFDIEINPLKFYRPGCFIENDFFDEKALVYTVVDSRKEHLIKSLTSEAIEKSVLQKDSKPTPQIQKMESELVEVDLHIQELVENYSGMQPFEILNVQLSRFATALETGLKSKTTRKMVFIHGLGNGKLKNEVIKKLQKEYPKLRYQDASFKEYGYGATLVFLK